MAAKAAADTSKPYFPLAGGADDGWSNEDEATATCFCGKVQMVVPIKKPGLLDTFICHCTDCRKITASLFASNFIVEESQTRFTRGQEVLKQFAQSKTIETGNTMTDHFCSNCGTLMFRVSSGAPGKLVTRIGTVDDFNVQEKQLKPRIETFTKDRCQWLGEGDGGRAALGIQQIEGLYYKAAL